MERIDALTSTYPMLIRKFDNSAFAANTAALEAAGIDPLDPQAPGVTFERRKEDGRATGIMTGAEGVRDLFRAFRTSGASRRPKTPSKRSAVAASPASAICRTRSNWTSTANCARRAR